MSENIQSLVGQLNKAEIEACAKDFWYFAQFLRTDDEERELIRPFPLNFDYLHTVFYNLENSKRNVILKSRRELVSLLSLARKLWKAKFAGSDLKGSAGMYYGGYSATDEELAKYQMARISSMNARLPDWLRSFNPLANDGQLFKSFELGGKIQGFPLKREGTHGFGFSDFTFDEASHQEAARSTYRGIAPSIGSGSIEIISTPNGKEGIGRFFFEIWDGYGDKYKDYKRSKIHWSDNPEHDAAWYKRVTDDLQAWEVQQQYELSFIGMSGMPVFPEFDRNVHVSKTPIVVMGKRTMYIMWDFGYHHPAVSFWQRNTKDQWVGLREFSGEDIDFNTFSTQALEFAEAFYERETTPEIHFIDPAGCQIYHQLGQSGAASDYLTIKGSYDNPSIWSRKRFDGSDTQVRFGLQQVGTRDNEAPRIKEVRQLLKLRADGLPGLIIDPSMEYFIDGMGGGYCYDDAKRGDLSEEPSKNSYSHLQDTFQYGVSGFNRMHRTDYNGPNGEKRELAKKRIGNTKYRIGR